MTEPTEPGTEPTTSAVEPRAAEPPNRWHRRDGIFRVAALVVATAGIVFIGAVIFWTGLMLGGELGDHQGHEGRGDSHQEAEMSHDSQPMEQGESRDNGDENRPTLPTGPSIPSHP